MNSDDSLDLMTLFTQSRSDANIHYLGIGQRLNDISCKVVERLRPFIGLTLGENSLRKLKAMIPDDDTKKRIQSLPKRHWIYLDGKQNPEIEIPEYKKQGTVSYLKPKATEQPKKLNLLQKFAKWYIDGKKQLEANRKSYEQQKLSTDSQTLEEQSKEDSEDDGIFSEGDMWFPEEM
jgi:hypothetical protein